MAPQIRNEATERGERGDLKQLQILGALYNRVPVALQVQATDSSG